MGFEEFRTFSDAVCEDLMAELLRERTTYQPLEEEDDEMLLQEYAAPLFNTLQWMDPGVSTALGWAAWLHTRGLGYRPPGLQDAQTILQLAMNRLISAVFVYRTSKNSMARIREEARSLRPVNQSLPTRRKALVKKAEQLLEMLGEPIGGTPKAYDLHRLRELLNEAIEQPDGFLPWQVVEQQRLPGIYGTKGEIRKILIETCLPGKSKIIDNFISDLK